MEDGQTVHVSRKKQESLPGLSANSLASIQKQAKARSPVDPYEGLLQASSVNSSLIPIKLRERGR